MTACVAGVSGFRGLESRSGNSAAVAPICLSFIRKEELFELFFNGLSFASSSANKFVALIYKGTEDSGHSFFEDSSVWISFEFSTKVVAALVYSPLAETNENFFAECCK
jgi:hypothetical protein